LKVYKIKSQELGLARATFSCAFWNFSL